MMEPTGILPNWVRRPETRWAMGGLLLVLIGLAWSDVLDTGLAITKIRDDIALQEQRLTVLRQERAESGAEPALEDSGPPVPGEDSLPRILSGLASAAGRAAATILEVNAPSTTPGSNPVTTRLRLTGHPGRVAVLLRELEQGPAGLLVTTVTVQFPQNAYGSTTWIVSGVLP